jgi:hypothetical protein
MDEKVWIRMLRRPDPNPAPRRKVRGASRRIVSSEGIASDISQYQLAVQDFQTATTPSERINAGGASGRCFGRWVR